MFGRKTNAVAVSLLLIFGAAGWDSGETTTALALSEEAAPCLTQVNVDGFGSALNRYSWAMAEFGGALYVGTYNAASDGNIIPIVLPGLGDPDSDLIESDGGEIWRFDGSTWEPVVTGGFNGTGGEGVRSLVEHEGFLYAGSHSATGPSAVWRSANGNDWERISDFGFGDPANQSTRALVSWNGALYAGTQNRDTGGELWRFDGDDWSLVADGGITASANQVLMDMRVYRGALWIGTFNQDGGGKVLRYDGTDFETVVGPGGSAPAGFGKQLSNSVHTIIEFDGALYVGLANFVGREVWRSADDGESWQNVTPNDPFDFRVSAYPWKMHVHDGALLLGDFRIDAGDFEPFRTGAILWSTNDGESWTQLVGPSGLYAAEGFGDPLNYGVRSMTTFEDEVYVGTAQCFFCPDLPVTGTEVWRIDTSCEPTTLPPGGGGCGGMNTVS